MTSMPDVYRTDARSGTAPTMLFIHGYLDSATVWSDLVEALGDSVNTIRYDLPGFGARHAESVDLHQISLPALAAEAESILASAATPPYIVGHSMGTQVAQLIAAQHPELVAGLILLTPVPLAGTRLPEEAVAPFRHLSADLDVQRHARTQLSPALTDRQLDRLAHIGVLADEGTASRYTDVWNDGVRHPETLRAFGGPVLLIGGGADGFVTQQVVDAVAAGFVAPEVRIIEDGGHWLHVEHPYGVAALMLDFVDDEANTPDNEHIPPDITTPRITEDAS